MNNRRRLLAILSGKPPDRIPWIPRLLIWYTAHQRAGTLPERYRDWSLRDIERDLGVGTPARDGQIFRTELRDVEVRERWLSPTELLTEYNTPAGTVSTRFVASEESRRTGLGDFQSEFMLKRREDYPVVEYIVEHTDYIATYDAYAAYEQEIGEDGYPMVQCGDCPFHHWMRALAGYNNAYYHLSDYPDEVKRLLAVMERRDREIVWRLMADSPADLILHGVHFSSQMTPPRIFDRYIVPYYQDLSALLRSRGKVLALHADNDTRQILARIERAGYGMAECFATHPLVPTTLAEARAAWGNRVIIWGGVPSIILEEPCTDAEFERYMDELFRTIAPGDAFILGVSDNVMPGAKIERLRCITQMMEERGVYPISR
jgi:uroporphyrinogen-III decarboxylase